MFSLISSRTLCRSFASCALAAWLLPLMADAPRAAVQGTDTPSTEAAAPIARAAYSAKNGVEQITLDLEEPVAFVAQQTADQLIIWFERPMRFDFDGVGERSDTRLKSVSARGAGPTRWMVVDVIPESETRSETLDDDHLVISIGPEGGPVFAEDETPDPADELPPTVAKVVEQESTSTATKLQPARDAKKNVAAAAETASDPKGSTPVAVPPRTPVARPSAPRPLTPAIRSEPIAPPVVAAAAEPKPPAHPQNETETQLRPASSPGQFEIDETALDRALERTLTREGAVLLPFGMVELEPSLTYVRQEFDTPALINLFGFPAFGEANITRDEYIASLALRIGLPFDAQLELDAPYSYINQSEMMAIGFDPVSVADDDTGAFGDLGVGLAKTVLREGAWWPDVVARVHWDSQTGKTVDNNIALGGGRHELTGSVSLVKSQDPLAFFGSVSYEKTFEEDNLDPGDRIGVSIGTVLAASPDTSLRVSLRQDFTGDAEFDGNQLEGTDQMAATLNIGASSVLGRGVLLDASAEVGLTEDAPDYAARLSLPVRFSIPRVFSLGGRLEAEEE